MIVFADSLLFAWIEAKCRLTFMFLGCIIYVLIFWEIEMSSDTLKLTEGKLGSSILKFSIPLVFSNLLQVLFNMADLAVVGQFGSDNSLGSVGSTTTLVTLFTSFLIGFAGGINAIVAKHIGARDKQGVSEISHTSALISLTTGTLVMLFGLIFARLILTLMNTKPEFIDGAVLYLRIYFIGMPALALYNYGNAVLSAAGDTKRPLIYLSISGVINITLNLIFVIVFKLDVAGVALASIISMYISATLIILKLFRSREDHSLRLHSLRLTRGRVSMLLGIAIPSGLQNAVFQVANLFVQIGVNKFEPAVVNGNTAALNADGVVFDVMAAFYAACTSFIGQSYGAGDKKRAIKSYYYSLAYSFAIGTVLGVGLAIFGRYFLRIFVNDPAEIEAGMYRLTVMGSFYGISAFMDCTIAASRGLGKSVVPTVMVLIGSCLFRLIWIYTVFAYFQTMTSLYLLYVFSWTITAVLEISYFRYIYKKTDFTAMSRLQQAE